MMVICSRLIGNFGIAGLTLPSQTPAIYRRFRRFLIIITEVCFLWHVDSTVALAPGLVRGNDLGGGSGAGHAIG